MTTKHQGCRCRLLSCCKILLVYVVNILFIHTYLKPGVQYGADLLVRPPRSKLFFFAAIPKALLNAALRSLQSADLQMSKGLASLCVPMYYIPISIVGKLVSFLISISFSKSVISAWVGFNSVCSFIPPLSMNKLMSDSAKDIILELLCCALLLSLSSFSFLCCKLFPDHIFQLLFNVS